MNAPAGNDLSHCDLIMKGGITSGVVYPKMIAALASKYRFKSIGGASAGAIAAAAGAAAEYGRQSGKTDSFTLLGELPTVLGKEDPATKSSRLLQMFQPAVSVAKHFKVLLSALNAGHPLTALGAAVWTIMRQFWGITLLAWLVGLLLVVPVLMMATSTTKFIDVLAVALATTTLWWLWTLFVLTHLSWLATTATPERRAVLWWLIGALLTAAVLIIFGAPIDAHVILPTIATSIAAVLCVGLIVGFTVARFAGSLIDGIHGNFYGLCSGRTVGKEESQSPLALTDWLTEYLNTLAGLPPDGAPLTFGQLWAGPHGDPTTMSDDDARLIDLKVMTTAVNQQMTYSIPFRASAPKLYYDPEEWQKLFPASVMKCLEEAEARENACRGTHKANDRRVLDNNNRPLRRLPANCSLPVVVAVRMSLSFPLLLSAVPLYAVDFSRTSNRREAKPANEPHTYIATRIWFSDGGICSNLPMHFFDAMLPDRPTFGINLKDPHPDFPIQSELPASQPGRVYLPTTNFGGLQRYWPAPDDAKPLTGLFGFLSGIVTTMQNWRDEIQLPYPGFRDRVAMISQLPNEGGLNLNMPKEKIKALSDAGEYAAQLLIDRFHAGNPATSEGWRNHQSVRLRCFLGVLEDVMLSLHPSLETHTWHDVVARELKSRHYNTREAVSATDTLDRMLECAEALQASGVSLEDKAPSPRPDMRLVPKI